MPQIQVSELVRLGERTDRRGSFGDT